MFWWFNHQNTPTSSLDHGNSLRAVVHLNRKFAPRDILKLWYGFESVRIQVKPMRKRITVLLADDHTVLREATAELIKNQPDMEVVGQAATGEETIALVESLEPDVVVMDIAMPRRNGLDATR